MSALLQRSEAEIRANDAYAALLWAISRPGSIHDLSDQGEAAIIDALIDRECHVNCADPTLMPRILRTGATLADLQEADHVFAGKLARLDLLDGLRVGSDLYPNDGATLVLHASLRSGPRLRVSGPGVDGTRDITVEGLPNGFWAWREKKARYPMGFEIFLLDGDQVMALPRSSKIEVL